MRKIPISKSALIKRLRAGQLPPAIARELGVSKPTIHRRLAEFGLRARPPKWTPLRASEQQKKEDNND